MPTDFYGGVPVDGYHTFLSIDLDESEEQVKDSPGVIHACFIANRSASELFVKFFDGPADRVEVGTTRPALVLALQPRTTASIGDFDATFTSGITVAAVTAVTDDARTGPAANEVAVNLTYA